MSVFSRPALRWLVPSAAAVVVIGGGAVAGTLVASADSSLPERSAAQLLVDVQSAKVDGLSGTVVESADLGLGAFANLTQGKGDLSSLLGGSNTARVWYAGETKARVALLGTQGETDVIRNGSDVYLWKSTEKTAAHFKIPAGADAKHRELGAASTLTPQQAADEALAAINPTTAVSTTGAAKVAGRDAYELVLSPKDAGSLIGQVRLAIDAEKHIPLRVDVYAKNATKPAVRVAFQQISFAVPDDQQFVFKAPAGTKVQESTAGEVKKGLADHQKAAAEKQERAKADASKSGAPKMIGTGWTTIVSAKLPKTDAADSQAKQLSGLTGMLPEVSGAWGKGHLFAGTLFSVLVTDDGRVFAGAVTPEKLYQAAA
ncbi:LolA family protein [Paractinoplanes ferrugineus]|uniref:LolA family protein n=1 Tax=Paractinoplanes ferrugineus TaxID=113564 RepID=UPI001942E29B|nr:sigma-E factor regulatory protein RseB domain-containing protein [Actinoplanes ferrugineus]